VLEERSWAQSWLEVLLWLVEPLEPLAPMWAVELQ
jgi:hypothetical protein